MYWVCEFKTGCLCLKSDLFSNDCILHNISVSYRVSVYKSACLELYYNYILLHCLHDFSCSQYLYKILFVGKRLPFIAFCLCFIKKLKNSVIMSWPLTNIFCAFPAMYYVIFALFSKQC